MQTNNKIINYFSLPEEAEKRRNAYYGEFLVLSNFDDGWSESMLDDLLIFCKEIINSGVDLRVFENIDKFKGEIQVVLRMKSLDDDIENKILSITTKLQRKFHLNPVVQNLGFGQKENSILPVELEDLNQNDFGYQREVIQKEYAKKLFLESKIRNLDYQIKLLDSNSNNDEAQDAILGNIKQLKNDTYQLLNKTDLEINELYANFYMLLSSTDIGTKTKHILSDFESGAVVDFGTGDEFGENILDYIKKLEKLTNENRKFGDELTDSFKELVKKLSNNTDLAISKLMRQFDIIVNESGIETNKKIGILVDYTLEGYDLVEAKLLGVVGSGVLKINDKIIGFELDGLIEDEIINIQAIEREENYIYSFIVNLSNGLNRYYFLENDNYKCINIKGITDFKEFKRLNYIDNGKTLSYGEVELENGNKSQFYLEDGIYKFLEIEGEKEFKEMDLSFSHGIPVLGKVHLKNGNQSIIYIENGEHKFLEIEGKKDFNHIDNYECGDTGYIPIYGEIKSEYGNFSQFYLEDGIYKFLEIEGEKEFKNLYFINRSKRKGGQLTRVNGNFSLFSLKDGKYKYLEIEGEKEFSSIGNIIYDINDKVTLGIVGNIKTNKKSIFNLKNGIYEFIEVNGEKNFGSIGDFRHGVSYNEIIGFDVVYYNKEGEDKEESLVYLEDGEYKILKIDGQSKFRRIYDSYFDSEDVLYRGEIKHKNGMVSFFYLKNNEYKFIEIEGENEFKGFSRIMYCGNNEIESGKIELKNDLYSMFILKDGIYEFLNIEGETQFNRIDPTYSIDFKITGGDIFVYEKNNIIKHKFKKEGDKFVFEKKLFGGKKIFDV